jgi:hypothetical protein
MTMLDPRERSLLLECLRPPEGCRLDFAVGTSFSLDLLALLTTPLAFTFFDWEGDTGSITADPLALLGAVRRHAERIALFCQAGQIAVPPAANRLTAYIESSVIEVTAPKGGVFHPKVWVLRYLDPDQRARIRLICLSRNLTFDRSWDVALVLDGIVADRQRGFRDNHPLGDFIEALPGLAVKGVSPSIEQRVQALATELRRVQWTYPEGIDAIEFWPIGLGKRDQWPFETDRARPILVMSPFVRDGLLNRVTESAHNATLISRPEELARLSPETLAKFHAVFAFDPRDESNPEDAEAGESANLSGLHAKVYIIDDGWDASVLIGSANATNGAFSGNVEFLTELRGKKSDFGIDATLSVSEAGEIGLRDLLVPWTPPSEAPDIRVLQREAMEKELNELKCSVGKMRLSVSIESTADQKFSMRIRSTDVAPTLGEARLSCWPSTLLQDVGKPLAAGTQVVIDYPEVTLDALTGFIAFELTLSRDGQSVSTRFVCLATVSGAPVDRPDRLLASMLGNREQLLRFIWLLLETQAEIGVIGDFAEGQGGMPWDVAGMEDYPIFERIVRTLAGDPQRLNDIGRLIEDLSRTPEGRSLLPSALTQIWSAIQKLQVAA